MLQIDFKFKTLAKLSQKNGTIIAQ